MKIICIERNYLKHIEELKNEKPSEPVVFLKPDSSLMRKRDAFYIPDWTKEVHYELELVVKINRLGKNIAQRFAHKYYAEFSLGIDFTARDVQLGLKSKGLPWEKAKAFDQSASVGKWLKAEDYDLENLEFFLLKNGEVVQKGNSARMIHSIPKLISHSSEFFTLKIGDLLFTGTPEGVGAVASGDLLEAFVGESKLLSLRIK